MDHSSIVSKNTTTIVFTRTDEVNPSIVVYKLSNTVSFTELSGSYNIVSLGNGYFKCQISTPDEDCYLCIVFGNYPIAIRVGNPILRYLHYGLYEGKTISYKHISSISGIEISSGNLTELGYGFYFMSPSTNDLSIIEVDDVPNILKLPYNNDTSSGSSSTGLGVPYNFFDTGYNMFAFPGGEYTRFDIAQGKWVAHTSRATAADLAKAVSYRYNLEWNDSSASNWVGKYISYLRTYDEESKVFRNYVPSVTPEANINNFTLMVREELGQISLRGITMYTTNSLETLLEGSSGLIMDFVSS